MSHQTIRLTTRIASFLLFLLLAACGGGSGEGGGSTGGSPGGGTGTPACYAVGGSVDGLIGVLGTSRTTTP